MSGNEDIIEAEETTEDIIMHDCTTPVSEEILLLMLVHIQANRANMPSLQEVNERDCVDQSTPTRVHDDDALLRQRKCLSIEHVFRGR